MERIEKLVKLHTKNLRKGLKEIGLNYIKVGKTCLNKKSSDFENDINLGWLRYSSDVLSICVSSDGIYENKKAVNNLIIPYMPEEYLFVDNEAGAVGTNFFYKLNNNLLEPILTDKPVSLDLFNGQLGGLIDDNENISDILMNSKVVGEITNDKIGCKKLLKKNGMKVPKHSTLNFTNNDYSNLVNQIREILKHNNIDNFVLKPNMGSQGRGIYLFKKEEVLEASHFVNQVYDFYENLLIEERIEPLEWKINDKKIDWNIRALLSMEENPKFIDAEVRYQLYSHEPVNISYIAKPKEFDFVLKKVNANIDEIIKDNIKAVKILYDDCIKSGKIPSGFVGTDTIISKEGTYFLEINSGNSGGFGTLAKIRKKKNLNIKEKLMPNLIRAALKNKQKNNKKLNWENYPQNIFMQYDVIDQFDKIKDYKSSLEYSQLALENHPNDWYLKDKVADSLIDNKLYSDCINFINKQIDFNDPSQKEKEVNYKLAWVYYKNGEYDNAENVIGSNYSFTDPIHGDSLIMLNSFKNKNYEKALRHFGLGYVKSAIIMCIYPFIKAYEGYNVTKNHILKSKY
jgi:hypothetical protein